MFERNLSVRLNLIANFAGAAKEAAQNLRSIVTGLEEIQKVGGTISLPGLTTLKSELGALAKEANLASGAMGKLGTKIAGVNAAVDGVRGGIAAARADVSGLGQAAEASAARVGGLGETAAATGRKARGAAGDMRAKTVAVVDLGAAAEGAAAKLIRLQTAATGLGVIRVDGLGRSLYGVTDAAKAAFAAIEEVDGALRRLNTALPAAQARAMLPGVGVNTRALPNYGPSATFVAGGTGLPPLPPGNDVYSVPGFYPEQQRALPGAPPILMLPGGSDRFYGGRARAEAGNDLGQGPGVYAAGGGVDRMWRMRQFLGSGQVSSDVMGFGQGSMRLGDRVQGAGYAGTVNFALAAGLMVPLIKSMTDLDDLFHRTYESLQANGMTPDNAKKLANAFGDVTKQTGGDYRQNVAAGYVFSSAIPRTANVNLNDPKQQALMVDAYKTIAKLNVAGGSSTHPMSMEETTLNTLASVVNLGLPAHSAKELHASIEYVANAMIQIKNKTSTEVDLIGNAIRAIGPIASNIGISPDEVLGLVAAEAEGKIRGATAGQNLKRIFSRQAMPPAKLAKLMQIVHDAGGDISMYDKQGNVKPMFDFFGEIGDFEKQHKLPAKQRAQLEGLLSGLYAGPALGELVRFAGDVRRPGETSSQGLRRFTQETLHGKVAGAKPGETPLDTSHRVRTENNVQTEAQKTDAAFLKEAHETFVMMEPDLVKVLKGIQGLVQAWHGLPDPTKQAILEFATALTVISGVLGVTQILIGNFIKLGGAMITVGGAGIKLFEFLMGFNAVTGPFGKIAGFFEGVFPRAFGVAVTAFRGLAVAMAANPVGAIIAALILAGTLLYEAWTHDFMGIREITAKAWSGVSSAFQNMIMGAGQLADRVGNGLKELHGAGTRAVEELIEGTKQALGNWVHSGEEAAKQFYDGIVKNLQGGVDRVKNALKPTGDLFPHSEPRDSSSPLAGMTQSGKATADMYVAGAIDALFSGAGKIKKAAKPVADVFLTLKNESVQHVEEMAQRIEAALKAAGAVIKDRYIDLFDPKTNQVTRVHGDVKAYRMAIGGNVHDTSVQEARDYLTKIQDELKAGQHIDTGAVVARLHQFTLKAATEHAVNEINHMAAQIEQAAHRAQAKLDAQFNKLSTGFEHLKTKLDTTFGSENTLGQKFTDTQDLWDYRVQRTQSKRKNDSEPTAKELQNEIAVEESERRSLTKIIEQEQKVRQSLDEQMQRLALSINALNDSDAKQHELKQQLIAQYSEYQNQANAIDATLEKQQGAVDSLTDSIAKQIAAVTQATTTWTGFFESISEKAAKAGNIAVFKGIADHVQTFFGLQNRATSSPQRQAANDYANNFIQQIFGSLTDTISNVSIRDVFHKGTSATKKHPGTLPYMDHIVTIKDHLISIDKNTSVRVGNLNSTSSTGAAIRPLDVVLRADGGGSTDVGSDISAALTTMSSISQKQEAGTTVGKAQPNDKAQVNGNEDQIANFQKMLGQASEAFSLYQGIRAGGIGGAVEAGSSAYALTQGTPAAPYATGVAAILGLIGIGPHETPLQQPDLNDPYYRQLLPNLAGTNQMLGNQVIQPELQYSAYAGNKNLAQQLYSFVSNPSSIAGQNPQMIQEIQQLQKLSGGSTTGLEIKSEHQGTATLNSGQQISVTDYETLINTVQSAMSAFQNSVLTQQENADRLASSFTSQVLGGPSGFIMPDYVGVSGGGGGGRSQAPGSAQRTYGGDMRSVLGAGISPGGPTALGGSSSPMSVAIHILEGATVQDGTNVQQAINEALPQIVQAVNQENYNTLRLSGNYTSETW